MTTECAAVRPRQGARQRMVFGICVALVLSLAAAALTPVPGDAAKRIKLVPMPVISRNLPAYTNDSCNGSFPAGLANDANYDTQWQACLAPTLLLPIYLAYDLSSVPVASRGDVVVAWYNDPTTPPYDHRYVSMVTFCCQARDIPNTFTIEANTAPGGTLPTLGWSTLVSVSDNSFHSRQHPVSLSGYNWLRMSITASESAVGDLGVRLNLDIHNAAAGIQDDWIFYGDSITQAGMAHDSLSSGGGRGTWAQLISALNPGYFPAYENGGIGGLTSTDGANMVRHWLPYFPGYYVGLAYGTNDAHFGVSPDVFYANYATMVQTVLAAGKVPIVPTIPWGCTPPLQANIPALNERIGQIYATYPDVVRGPDLWSYFRANQSLMSDDCVHPTTAGYAAYRQQWANAAWANVYRRAAADTAEPEPTPTPPPGLPTLPPLLTLP